MAEFWVKEAIDILRQNGSQEAADAIDALAARLAEIAAIAHDGGLYTNDQWELWVAVRKLTLAHWRKEGDEPARKARVAVALGAADSASEDYSANSPDKEQGT